MRESPESGLALAWSLLKILPPLPPPTFFSLKNFFRFKILKFFHILVNVEVNLKIGI